MRRADREVTGLLNILAILERCEVLRLGLCANGRPYIVPMNFAFEVSGERLFIYLHCSPEGKKTDIIAANSAVCFEADLLHEVYGGASACGWSAKYESVMGEGVIELLREPEEKRAALGLLMKRHGFAGEPQFPDAALREVAVLRIEVSSVTGKSSLS